MDRFSKEYTAFRAGAGTTVRERGKRARPAPQIPERLVACLWYSQRYLKGLRTADGRPVSVLSPGVWNLEDGPDFLRAAVRVDEAVITGDIEVHVNSSDWAAHGHHQRPEYDGVVLHVAMWNDKGTSFLATASGKRVPQVVLSEALTQPLERVVKQVETDDYPYRKRAGLGECAQAMTHVRRAELERLVLLAGEWRMQEKAARFSDWLREQEFDEVLYRAVMEALGYDANKEAMRTLAERVPLAVLRAFAEGRRGRAAHYAVQAVLLGVSGLLPAEADPEWDKETSKFHEFLKGIWDGFRDERSYFPMDAGAWSSRGRPANSPMRRIAAASLWLHARRKQKLLPPQVAILDRLNRSAARFGEKYERFRDKLVARREALGGRGSVVAKASREALARVVKLFDVGADRYWSRHYTLGGRILSRPMALIGPTRLEEIVVNVVVPVLLLYARRARPELEGALLMLFQAAPKGVDNKVTRLMKHRLFGTERHPLGRETAAVQQGLLQLFKDYCSKDKGGCLECGFRESLLRWADPDRPGLR